MLCYHVTCARAHECRNATAAAFLALYPTPVALTPLGSGLCLAVSSSPPLVPLQLPALIRQRLTTQPQSIPLGPLLHCNCESLPAEQLTNQMLRKRRKNKKRGRHGWCMQVLYPPEAILQSLSVLHDVV